MKKTFNINLAGYPFVIDDDAFNLLKDYLDTIRYAFDTKDDTEDIAADIESRIAEILLESSSGNPRIINLQEISNVIERIGKPSDFIEIDDSMNIKEEKGSRSSDHNPLNDGNVKDEVKSEEIVIEENVSPTPPPYNPEDFSRNPFVRKRLFRDPQNSLLGGVCSGLAAYLNMDPTIIRLLTVVLFFLSATTVAIVYIVLWIVVPPANTPLQRMRMRGESPTMENIGKSVTENYNGQDRGENPGEYAQPQGFLSNLVSILSKCLIIFGLIIGIPLLIALALGFVGCLVAVFVLFIVIAGGVSDGAFWMFNNNSEEVLAVYILLAVIGGIITVGIPLFLLVKKLWKKNDTELSPTNRRSLLVIWLCGIALLAVFCVKATRKAHDMDRWRHNVEQLEDISIFNEKSIENFDINEEGVTITTKKGNKISITKDGEGIRVEKTNIRKGKTENVAPEEGIALEESTEVEIITTADSIAGKTPALKRDSVPSSDR